MSARGERGPHGPRRRAAVVVASAALAAGALAGGVATSQASHAGSAVSGHSTRQVTICPNTRLCPTDRFTRLKTGPGESHVVRQELAGAKAGRAGRRRSLAYFAQISDFQLSDEESPARVEPVDDEPSGFASSAWRPQEAMIAHEADRTVRQVNHFLRSPIPQGDGRRARLLNSVLTGDLADSQQRNEMQWVVSLLEGGTYRNGRRVTSMLDPSSGTRDRNGFGCPKAGPIRDLDNPRRYTGVQDYSDYPGGQGSREFYDPNHPRPFDSHDWPRYQGLMDRAQQPFRVQGLKVPSYIAFGNHDNLIQGNERATQGIERIATGCVKAIAGNMPPGFTPPNPADFPDALPPIGDLLNPARLAALPANEKMLVPRDERRQIVDKVQSKRLYRTGRQRDQHGFGYVDPAEERASHGAASYYDFSPKPGIRYVVLDTVSEGGQTPESSEGNIDNPQFQWLRRSLERATRRDELIFIFSHHAPSSSQGANVPDEASPPCTGANDGHGHDPNPGCDRDPRPSTPIHLGNDTIRLLHRFPHVIGYVAGHSHQNEVTPIKDGRGGGFWQIKSPAIADWTTHHRLLETMDNRDGTLSIFGTLLDFDAPVTAPRSGANASTFDASTLASVGRLLTYNDPQQGPDGSQGTRKDRNVELLIRDPRRKRTGGERTINGTDGDDVLRGTSGDDVINCGAGNDRVYAGAGNDTVNCGPGDDVIHGGSGNDLLRGESGNDTIYGDSGDDRIDGGPGNDSGYGASGRDSFTAVERRRQD